MNIQLNAVLLFVFGFTFTLFAQTEVKTENQELRCINRVLDSWHERAAVADTTYFELFADNALYLGTDAKEIWTIQEFEDLYMSFFKRGTAWNFKMKDRNVYLGDYGHYAWVDESLDTWMGLCRGTAVMEKNTDGQWRIKHYSLTVLVSNDLITDYVKLLNRDE
jgi:ketosteroid isomerase-like protein